MLRSYYSLASDLRSGKTSPSQVLAQCFAELDRREPTLKAFVTQARESATASAKASDARWKAGKPLSPIDGMPMGIKDIIETADMPTGQGNPYWAGFETKRDAAGVQALREAGAVIVGKTTTTEYATSEPLHETTNPHDSKRTPGGSSSGSAAAVGAGILSAALGTQVVASTLRPSSFCGVVGFKPTVGGLNRSGSYDHLSQSCTGILAASPGDAWIVASAIVERVGGDPGFVGLQGPTLPPAPRKPLRFAVLETGGWAKTTPGARAAFAKACEHLSKQGIELVDRRSDIDIEGVELAIACAFDLTFNIYDWEFRWPLRSFAKGDPRMLGAGLRQRQVDAAKLTMADYRADLAKRQAIRERWDWVAERFDGFITLGATGAAPVGLKSTGDPAVNVAASLLGVPAMTLPLLADEGLPLGLQILGRADRDADLFSVAEWIWASSGLR